MDSLWLDVLEQVKAKKAEIAKTIREAPKSQEPPVFRSNQQIQYVTNRTLPSKANMMTLDEIRQQLPVRLKTFTDSAFQDKTLLLVVQPAGTGKTYKLLEYVQTLAEDGKRVLWCAGRHETFFDLQNMPHFKGKLWYHWQPLTGTDPVSGDPMCRYVDAQLLWSHKGYPTIRLCHSLCPMYHKQCPFRVQKDNHQPIWFAMHNHLASGLPRSDFDIVIIDENPMTAFVHERKIPREQLVTDGMSGIIKKLFTTMQQMPVCSEKELIKPIADMLQTVIDMLEHMTDNEVKQFVPFITRPEDVENVPYWYLPHFLLLAIAELACYKNEWPHWNSRIRLTDSYLVLYMRYPVWKGLPKHVIALDATADKELYNLIFPAYDVHTYMPDVVMTGKVTQIANRLYGLARLADNDTRMKEAAETVAAIVSQHGYKNVGLITHKKCREQIEQHIQNMVNVSIISGHFYALRGTNTMQDCDAIFVIGAPSPDMASLIKTALCLTDDMVPFSYGENGKFKMLFSYTKRIYYYEREGVAERLIGGYWTHPTLNTLYQQFREMELLQMIHRGRPNMQDIDIYVLTSVPTSVWLHDLKEEPFTWTVEIEAQRGRKKRQLSLNWLHIQKIILMGDKPIITAKMLSDSTGIAESTIKKQRWLDILPVYLTAYQVVRINKEKVLKRNG